MSPTIHSVALSTGLAVPYVEQGDPAGVPVILLHGYSDSWRSYELLLPQLPPGCTPTRSPSAATATPTGPRRLPAEDYAADVAAFMDAVGIEAAVIVGHSGGSYTAQRFALDHPDRTLGIVLVGAFHSFRDNAGVSIWQAVIELTDPVDPDFVREFQESTVARPVPDGYIDAIVAESLKLPARVWKALPARTTSTPGADRDRHHRPPTLILWGDQDAFCPRGDQDALVAAIPRARLVVYRAPGHAPIGSSRSAPRPRSAPSPSTSSPPPTRRSPPTRSERATPRAGGGANRVPAGRHRAADP